MHKKFIIFTCITLLLLLSGCTIRNEECLTETAKSICEFKNEIFKEIMPRPIISYDFVCITMDRSTLNHYYFTNDEKVECEYE